MCKWTWKVKVRRHVNCYERSTEWTHGTVRTVNSSAWLRCHFWYASDLNHTIHPSYKPTPQLQGCNFRAKFSAYTPVFTVVPMIKYNKIFGHDPAISSGEIVLSWFSKMAAGLVTISEASPLFQNRVTWQQYPGVFSSLLGTHVCQMDLKIQIVNNLTNLIIMVNIYLSLQV
jgi:hypothetical protein